MAYNSKHLDNKCIFISCTLEAFKRTALIDSECFAYACIDTFAQVFLQELLPKHQTLRSHDEKIFTTTRLVKIRMSVANDAYEEDVPMFVTPGLHYDIILGMPWLKRHKPIIEWDCKSVTFNSDTCQSHCLKANNIFPITIHSCQRLLKMPEPVQAPESFKPLQNTLIPIRAIAFQHLASNPDHEVFRVSLRDIEHALKPKIKTDPATVLPEVYREFLKVFSYEEANKLPPAQPGINHIIRMQPGTQPPARPLYGMSRDELEVQK